MKTMLLRLSGLAALLSAQLLVAGGLEQKIAAGNELYNQEQYDSALRTYQEAPKEQAASPFLRYDIGNTLYQQGKYPEAIDEFRQVYSREHPELNRAAQYNTGCAQYRIAEQQATEQKLPEAIRTLQECCENYKFALREFPGDPDLQHNFSQASRRLKELQEQQKQQEQQQQDKNQDQQQDQQKKDQQNQQDQKQDRQKQDKSQQNQDQQQQGEQQQKQDQTQQQQGDQQKKDQQQQQKDQQGKQDQQKQDQTGGEKKQQEQQQAQDKQDQAANAQPSEAEMQEASREMARQILQGLFDDSKMQQMDRLYRPAKMPGKVEKDW